MPFLDILSINETSKIAIITSSIKPTFDEVLYPKVNLVRKTCQ